jgi:gas vesicle protein
MGPRGMARRRGRRRGLVVGAAVGSAAARRNADKQSEQYYQEGSSDDTLMELEKLGQLRDQGVLTEDEFTAKKKQVLGI